MAEHRRTSSLLNDDDSILPSRTLEAFSRKVTATAGSLMSGSSDLSHHYQNAMGDLQKELRHPLVQRNIFALAAAPRELVRSKLSSSEIQHRALSYLPDELLRNVPEPNHQFSLFQGFQATHPDSAASGRLRRSRRSSKAIKLLEERADAPNASASLKKLRNERNSLDHRLEMMEIRKNMCSTEIKEVDNKIANLNSMRKILLNRMADLEQEEADVEQELYEADSQLEDLQEEFEDEEALKTPQNEAQDIDADQDTPETSKEDDNTFMSQSIYQQISSPQSKRPKPGRRKTTFDYHDELKAGSKIRDIAAHNDTISALDFDYPFGTLVTAALDDTVRVWDMSSGQCMGALEGHLSSVRCLQVEDHLVATGSMDATIRLWDLSRVNFDVLSADSNKINKAARNGDEDPDSKDEDSSIHNENEENSQNAPTSKGAPSNLAPPSLRDCAVDTLSAHVAEITALHFHNNTLISGSADKTLRQWDIERGRCVQTLDVLWAAAQAASTTISTSTLSASAGANAEPALSMPGTGGFIRQASSSRLGTSNNADFVGALQCFDAALACGTADGMVRLWDLRSGLVHRSLVGHTGPVTCLQFDDTHLVTGSMDRSVRIWDLRTGSIFDAYAYENPITSLMFDPKSIAASAGEPLIKIYDKTDGRHWDCGGVYGETEDQEPQSSRIVDLLRLKEGYLVGGRLDGSVGIWSC